MKLTAIMAATFAGSLGLAAPVWADEAEEAKEAKEAKEAEEADEKVQLSELPAQVRQTVERETKGATINEIEREAEGDRVTYEVELTRQGERWEIEVDAYGKVIDRHRD